MYNCSKIKYLYPEEKEALFYAIENAPSRYSIRNRAIFYLAEYAALRASEIGLIEMADINLRSNEVYFKRLKTATITSSGSSILTSCLP